MIIYMNKCSNVNYCMTSVESEPWGAAAGVDVVSFLFPQDSHFLSAGIEFHCCTAGPSDEILMRQSSVSVFKQLH